MLRGVCFRHFRAASYVSRRSYTPTPVACPITGRSTTTQALTHPTTDRCLLVGTAPAVRCPVEADFVQRTTPSLYTMTCQMGKVHLSAYVAATGLAGYVLGGGFSPLLAAAVTAGTMLQSCSANTANQVIEVPYDKLMKRTCRRPLPMKFITPQKAILVSATEMALGTAILYAISPAAAALGCANWILYVCMYTPLKRISAINTWFGSIVGGIPPIMGGLAAAGTVTNPVWMLSCLLFIWQIPHFNGLAFHCRRDYEAAGYKMLAFYNPWRASFYAVALSVLMAFITLGGPPLLEMPVEGFWYYPVTTAVNAVMIYKSVLFHQSPVEHCRGCFVFSYVYLSIMLVAIMLNHLQPTQRVQDGIQFLTSKESTEQLVAVADS